MNSFNRLGFSTALALFVAAIAPLAHAGSITSTWRPPLQYTGDGSKITAPISYRMEYGPEGGELKQSVNATTTTATATDLAPGRWCNRIVAIVENVESDATDIVCVTVPAKETPPPPPKKKPGPPYFLQTTAAP